MASPRVNLAGCSLYRTIACAPLLQGMSHEVRAIVHVEMGRCWIHLEQILDCVDHIYIMTTATHPNRQADTAIYIDVVQEFEGAAIHCLAKLDLDRPEVVRILSSQQVPGSVYWP